ncbi:ATP-binding protein [Breoghania sp.]|uniref:sensor histidine kinase n=1 Tax=Breoghania sp. TaxID=2065378 RepID=UPI002AA79FD4|nr:ATP-binding protein [Breoghania sp.]
MRGPRSLQLRLALALGLAITLMWLAAAAISAHRLRYELDVEFDSALRNTAHRLLSLASRGERLNRYDLNDRERPRWGRRFNRGEHDDKHERDDHEDESFFARARDHNFSYAIFDESGQPVFVSEGAKASDFPPFERTGFLRTDDRTFFYDRVNRAGRVLTIAVMEPLARRAASVREMAMSLSLPMLIVIPLTLVAIFLVVRRSLRPFRALREDLGRKSAYNLEPVADHGLPSEVTPVVSSLNALLSRLRAAFEAERSFAANAAHELRTPVAGAIAQAQRLQAETSDEHASARAVEIETTLKRLNSLSEKLMQLARAEGARLRTDEAADLRPILRMIVDDFERLGAKDRIELSIADEPVLSDLDPDAFGILSRNLIENALKHGTPGSPITVSLERPAVLKIANASPTISPEDLRKLTTRFVRANGKTDGTGLGLAIVRTIADRANAKLTLLSPAPGRTDGLEVRVSLASGA